MNSLLSQLKFQYIVATLIFVLTSKCSARIVVYVPTPTETPLKRISLAEDKFCPRATIGNESERAYTLQNETSKSDKYSWDVIPVYPHKYVDYEHMQEDNNDMWQQQLQQKKCIFKRLSSKYSSKSTNFTLHSIFRRESPGNLHTGGKCSDFVKFVQIDQFEEVLREFGMNDSKKFSFTCDLQNEGEKITLNYFSDKIQLDYSSTDSRTYAPVIIFVFVLQSATSCVLQVQQHWTTGEDDCTKYTVRHHLGRACAHYEDCSDLTTVLQTVSGPFVGHLTYDYDDAEPESEGFLDLPTIELFIKGLIFPTLILWAANLGYILLKRRMMRQNSARSSSASTSAPRYPEFPPPSYEHATCLPTYQEAISNKLLSPEASTLANSQSVKSDEVAIEIVNKTASESSLPEC